MKSLNILVVLLFFCSWACATKDDYTSAVSFFSTDPEKKFDPNGLPQIPGFYCITGNCGSSHEGSAKYRSGARVRSRCVIDISNLSPRQSALLRNSSPIYRELIKNGAKIISYRDLVYQKLSQQDINNYPTIYRDSLSGALISFHPLHLVHNPCACAHWAVQAYWEALGILFGDLYGVEEIVDSSPEYKCFLQSSTDNAYVHDADRHRVMQQWPLYDYSAFWEFIQQHPDYQQCIVTIQNLIDSNESVRSQLSAYAKETIAAQAKKIIACHQAARARVVQEQRKRDQEAQLIRKQQEKYEQKLLDEVEKQKKRAQLCEIKERLLMQHNALDHKYANKNRLQHMRNGLIALQKVINGDDATELVTRELNDKAASILQDLGIDTEQFERCYGNAIATAKHAEIIDIVNAFGELSMQPKLHTISSMMCGFASNAQTCNKNGSIKEANAITDFCWDVFEYAHAVGGGVWDGLQAIGYSIGDLVTQPRVTITHAVNALTRASSFIADLVISAIQCNAEVQQYAIGQFIRVQHSNQTNAIDASLKNFLLLSSVAQAVSEHVKNTPGPEIVRAVIACGVELYFVPEVYGELLHGASLLYKNALSCTKRTLARMPKAKQVEHVLLCAESGAEVNIAVEATKALEKSLEAENKIPAITAGGNKIGSIIPKFAELDAAIGDLAKLERAAEAIKDIPGAQDLLKRLYETGKKGAEVGNLGTARGAAYEIEKAYEVMHKGESVIGVGIRSPLRSKVTGEVIKILEVDMRDGYQGNRM